MGFSNSTCADEVLATQLKPMLTATKLDETLQSGESDIATLRDEWVDAFRYARQTTKATLNPYIQHTCSRAATAPRRDKTSNL